MNFRTNSEGNGLPSCFWELSEEYKEILIACYKAATRGAEPQAVQSSDSFDKMPLSIKNDILTLGLPNDMVEAKITDWLRSSYIDPLLR